jgi:hypothetical protein
MNRLLAHVRSAPAGAVIVKDKLSDAVAYVWTDSNGKPCAKGYHGTANKPDYHYRFAKESSREKQVREHFESRRASLAAKAKRAAEDAAARAKGHGCEVGSIFVCSWGYEQTNVDWYQVVELRGKSTVVIRQIHSADASNGNEGWAQGKSIPAIDHFKGDAMVKRIVRGRIAIESYASAHLWDGRPRSWTAYH